MDPEIDQQSGFRKGKGTRNAIFAIKMLSKVAIEMQNDIVSLL